MRRHTNLATAAALALIAPALLAWAKFDASLTLQPQSKLWISGTSTVRSFECRAQEFEATVATTHDGAVRAVLAGEKAVSTVEVTVPAAKLDCANGTMNSHMLKALKAQAHPTIAFKVASYDLAQAGAGVQVTLKGELTLGGTTKPITVEAVATDGGDGTLLVTGKHQVRMKEFGLKPPTLMLGTLKVDEKIDVNFALFLKN